MEPETTLGLALTAYLAKDGITKLLGPTADYLGEGLRDLTQRRLDSIGRIFSNASAKLGGKLDDPGQVPPRILKTVINEGSYSEDSVVLEYFGGVLASSRTECGRDDRGARIAKLIDGLSTYQIRSHYLLYSSIKHVFSDSAKHFRTSEDRAKMQIFLPIDDYYQSMEFTESEWNNGEIMLHIWNGLSTDELIEDNWAFGSPDMLKKLFSGAPGNGIVCTPSLLGVELFLWAFAHGGASTENLLSAAIDTGLDGLPKGVTGALATRS